MCLHHLDCFFHELIAGPEGNNIRDTQMIADVKNTRVPVVVETY